MLSTVIKISIGLLFFYLIISIIEKIMIKKGRIRKPEKKKPEKTAYEKAGEIWNVDTKN